MIGMCPEHEIEYGRPFPECSKCQAIQRELNDE